VSVNKQIILGRLGKDPENKVIGDSSVTSFSVATDESWTDKSGNTHKETEWFEVSFWGKQAETIFKYFGKGGSIYIEGKTKTRSYPDKDGVKQYRREVKGEFFRFVDGASSGKDKDGKPTAARSDDDGPPAGGSSTDDIPF